MTLKLYGDLLSQPARAVDILLRANNVEYEFEYVSLRKGEHLTSAMKALNPRGQVPFIIDDGFVVCESSTIMRYLCQKYSLPDHWYPADLKSRTGVDTLLDWYHSNLRATSGYVFMKGMQVSVFKMSPPREEYIKLKEDIMLMSLKILEESYLTEEGSFLLGASQPTIADVLLGCEVTQTCMLDEADRERVLGGKPKIAKWLAALEETTAPHFAEVHTTIRSTAKEMEASSK
ncbi:glutathione S-transferase [Marchantia polymorpha subsp. ruderalis]